MYEIVVTGHFNATHQLRLPDGALEPVNGHDWRVAVCLRADALDAAGFVADFEAVKAALDRVTASLHHRDLNKLDCFCDVNASAENVARHIYDCMADAAGWGGKVHSVEVTEAPGCVARFVRDG